MIRNQRKHNPNIGNDTFVRNKNNNIFQQNSSFSFQVLPAEVSFLQNEPAYKQTMATVEYSKNGKSTAVAIPSAPFDRITRNIHGLFEAPRQGDMVMVGFSDGNPQSPYILNRYPYQARGNSAFDTQYFNPMTQKGWSDEDVILGHFAGSYLRFSTFSPLPASTQLYSVTDLEIETSTLMTLKSVVQTDIQSTIVKLTGNTHIELNGNTNFAVNYNEMKIAFDTLRTELNTFVTLYNSHTHQIVPPGVPGTPTAVPNSPGIPAVADMSLAQNLKVLL